jgi:predicted kinase
MMVLMAGLPGTGKTTLAHALAERTKGRVLSKDEFRHAIFRPEEVEYSSRQDDFCLQLMLETATYLLRLNPTKFVFLDGRPFSRRYQIENAVVACASVQQPWRILECVCSDKTARQRLEQDAIRGTHPAENRDHQLYVAVKDRFEAITRRKTVIDTDLDFDICIQQALKSVADYGMD